MKTMKAMVLERVTNSLKENPYPLLLTQRPIPIIGEEEILVRVLACGLCHTELDEIEGRTPPPQLPVILGHQIVGSVVEKGERADKFEEGDRVGIGWIYHSCRVCEYCRRGLENLCQDFQATGRDVDGGFAEWIRVHQDYATSIPPIFSAIEAAPLLCGGSIGYRSLRLSMIEDGDPVGLTGFGSSGHLVLKIIKHLYPKSKIHVFARREETREFALSLGADWVGSIAERPPHLLEAIIDTTPAWGPVLAALESLRPGGRLVINAIRKEYGDKEILENMSYERHLWMEKEMKSVANVTHRDIKDFLALAGRIPIRPKTTTYQLEDANRALMDLKLGKGTGAKVLTIT